MEVETWKRIRKQQIQIKTNLQAVEIRILLASATMTELIAKQAAAEAATRTKLMQGQTVAVSAEAALEDLSFG